MSAFCVFGVTYDACMKQAQKKVAPHIKEEGAPVRKLTAEEYQAAVKEKADELFKKVNAKQCSPSFDAPQFANEWISLAKRSGARALKVMCKGQKKDKKGAPVIKNGKPVIGWIPFAG